jgi:peptidoglycan/LPS O-acetylase OafA/YrhL
MPSWLLTLTSTLVRGGWIGVDLFFVLSGYLVSGLLFEEHKRVGHVSAGRFLARRGFKIYPPFYFLVVCSVLLATLVIPHGQVRRAHLWAELLFVQNYFPGLWSHTWSLGVEEHFYLLLPLSLLALLVSTRGRGRIADPFRRVPVIVVGVALACLALRLQVALTTPYAARTHVFPTHLRIDSLLFGVALAYWRHYRTDWFFTISRCYRAPFAAGGLLCLLPAFVIQLETHWFVPSFGFSLVALGAGMLLWGFAGAEPSGSLPARAMAFVGARSYSVYLWHIPMLVWGIGAVVALYPRLTWPQYVIAYFAGSIAVGLVMHAVVEAPMLRLRDRLVPSRSSVSRQAARTRVPLIPVPVLSQH